MDIKFIEKDQQWQNEQTVYWFSVNEENYGIADQGGDLTLLDFEGYPIDECNDHENIKAALIPHYEKHIMD
ncbi:hypothetical protein NFHSH190041_37060 (plasmid) [Shewanella sp. NFH-SH190041]|uniref:hypothetical protein n=1 Tax=Shewanella sp. NFH-SH190041 TaxID=2950245 RepID=UPI0021C2B5FF|nr:hypothetical protein [Shewanella sp. NFH-SH190041]BDM66254.1 hypothetical protein NFHSH190041_37060 [Shewanella sp. NFH-SH190041]